MLGKSFNEKIFFLKITLAFLCIRFLDKVFLTLASRCRISILMIIAFIAKVWRLKAIFALTVTFYFLFYFKLIYY